MNVCQAIKQKDYLVATCPPAQLDYPQIESFHQKGYQLAAAN